MKILLPCLASVLSLVACKPESKPEPAPPPAAAAQDPSKPASYLGLDEAAAGQMADKAGLKWRIIEVDGESRPVTMDYQPERLNFAIKGGKVIRVTQG